MKLIDWECKGNLVRFYFGKDALEKWWGDDWNDTPYEHNAGEVYSEFITDAIDVAFPFDALVCEPSFGTINSNWCKDDMVARRVPCVTVLADKDRQGYIWAYEQVMGDDNAVRFYFGDWLETVRNNVAKVNGLIITLDDDARWWVRDDA